MFDLLYDLSREMNNCVKGMNGSGKFNVDIIEGDNSYYVNCAMPGFKKENIEVTFNDSILTIKGKKEKEENKKYILKENVFDNYERSFVFNNLNVDEIKAKYENGILAIEIKANKPEIKNIQID